jgi:hypothetical protein
VCLGLYNLAHNFRHYLFPDLYFPLLIYFCLIASNGLQLPEGREFNHKTN